jgi:hypothetical protein
LFFQVGRSVEAVELVVEFQWPTEEQSRGLVAERRERVRPELTDVFVYLLRVADNLGVGLVATAGAAERPDAWEFSAGEHAVPAKPVARRAARRVCSLKRFRIGRRIGRATVPGGAS